MALTIRSSFSVAASRDATWAILTDIERAAPCFPGAQLQGRNDDGSWRATFGVKLGPMSFSFAGRFSLAQVDDVANRVLVQAQGSDTKGRGGAKADVDVRVVAEPAGTHVDITSTVDLSGSVAQFGRGAGMIEALSRQLLQQFAANLQLALHVSGESALRRDDHPHDEAVPMNLSSLSCRTAAPIPAAAPINAATLGLRAILSAIRSWIARRIGALHSRGHS